MTDRWTDLAGIMIGLFISVKMRFHKTVKSYLGRHVFSGDGTEHALSRRPFLMLDVYLFSVPKTWDDYQWVASVMSLSGQFQYKRKI